MKIIIRVDKLDDIIRNISEIGIDYIVDGEPYFVDFADCHRSYLETCKERGASEISRASKRVGQRDILNSPPNIEFFTTPITRFEFESVEDFHEVRHRVRKKGWTTMELS
ncbi:MAG: hypothetical protein AAFQ07_13240 [Chloroflexota bacterium]